MKHIGVLAFHGDVTEHIETTIKAAHHLQLNIEVIPVRTKDSVKMIDGLIIPGGESTTLFKLCQGDGMWDSMKRVKNIFGTCAGAILLAKTIYHKSMNQKTLELMDIEVDRNAYGRQSESFEKEIKTNLGNIRAIFIRAPKIKHVGKEVNILARNEVEIIACEETMERRYYLASCFHPEFTTTLFHEYFLKKVYLKDIVRVA